MSRKPRVHFPEVVYHVIWSGGRRRKYQITKACHLALFTSDLC